MSANGYIVDINRATAINLSVVCATCELDIVECLPVFSELILKPVSTPEAVNDDALAVK